ncbi:helix-turn-helix domain-containing protein, partial [Salmonella enterica]|nr:helix-turn-helix domain-containing protein [Salmonella enterica]
SEARLKGIQFGRKRTIDREQIKKLHVQGLGATKIAKQMNIARSTVYSILSEMN